MTPQRRTAPADARTADADAGWMRQALRLARRGSTHPNPRVGAVVVRNGRAVGSGYHRVCGAPHAEAAALASAGRRARGATVYVTLEPCDHTGRTPPCAPALVAAGIARVVVGARDPNPRVRGRGLRRLREAGITVDVGVLAAEATALNRAYNWYMRRRRPWVEIKTATTLDGRTALRTGASQWITGPSARRAVHRLRAAADAVVVGGATVRADDPALTVRHGGGRQPVRVVITRSLRLSESSRVFDPRLGPSLVVTSERAARGARAARLAARGVQIVGVGAGGGGLDLDAALDRLAGEHGLLHLMVESGGGLAQALFDAGLVCGLHVFMAPRIMGAEHRSWSPRLGVATMDDLRALRRVRVRRVGDDVWVAGELVDPPS